MSDPDSSRSADDSKRPDAASQKTASGRSAPAASRRLTVIALIVLVLIAVFVAAISLINREDDPRQASGEGSDQTPRLELTRTALASTENLEVVQADQAWSQLAEQSPDDPSILRNLAINRVLRVDQLAAQATNAALGDSEKRDARQQLPEAIAAARDAIDRYGDVSPDDVLPMWLAARVDLHEASLLPGSLTKSLRREVYGRLSEAINGKIGENPDAIILGGTLIEVVEQLEDPIDGLPDDLIEDAARTIGNLSDQHEDNLFFALRAARFNIDIENKNAIKYVQRAAELAKAIEPSLRRETEPIGVTPDELVQQIITAIEQGNWSETQTRMLLWFNVLNSTEIVKTDRRRAAPHPLDRLSFDALRRLSAEVAAGSPLPIGKTSIAFDAETLEDSAGSTSLAVVDYDLDLDPDLCSVDAQGTMRLWNNDEGQWTRAGQLSLEMETRGLLAADLFVVDSSDPQRLRSDRTTAADSGDYATSVRHDTFVSLVAFGDDGVRLIQIDGQQTTASEDRLQIVSRSTGLEDLSDVVAATVGDLEADGDLDLVLATRTGGIRMFANRGNRTFFEIQPAAGDFAQDDPVTAMAIADLDRDLDLDIVTVHSKSGRVGMIENLLHLQFRGRYFEEIDPIAGASSIEVAEIDANVSWDLVIGGAQQAAIVYSQTADAGAWTIERIERVDTAAPQLTLADLNNDSWFEAIRFGEEQSFWQTLGPWGFSDDVGRSDTLTAQQAPVHADFNNDGLIDLAGIDSNQVQVFVNRLESAGHYLDVRFRGIDDNASGRVNHFAIGSVLELRFGPHYRAKIVTSPETHFGLNDYEQADTIRAILPNGLTQTIRAPKIDSLVEEEQTLKGSCPYLYAWDGEKFVFKTDCLWAAPLGLQVARGVVAKDRPWEYLKIDGHDIALRDDHYEFRITEELWEVAYFDKVALSVVDHPSDVEVWTNEKVGPGSIAEPSVFAFADSDLHELGSAVDTDGDDVTQKLSTADRDFVQGFDHRLRQGLCPPHWIDLDFNDSVSAKQLTNKRIYLVMTGWILPTDTSLNIQIDQNPDLGPIEFPSVWVPESEGSEKWTRAVDYMGFPGGKTKTIVVDVTDVILPQDRRLRVRTSAQIYWDAARLAVQQKPATHEVQAVELVSAEVGFHGFSQRIRHDTTRPEVYDYQNATTAPRWPPLRGELTRFGTCTELIRHWDDRMVVISGGDEIRLRFSAPQKPLPEGWQRDFVLHNVGWDKDADLNTLAGQSIGPLPSREMTAYPPPADQQGRQQQLRSLNATHRQRQQAFRAFWYRESTDVQRPFREHATPDK